MTFMKDGYMTNTEPIITIVKRSDALTGLSWIMSQPMTDRQSPTQTA